MTAEIASYDKIKESLAGFLDANELDSAACLSTLDDIILGYVAGVLSDLGREDSSENFDLDDFIEMISAYCPTITSIPQVRISTWIHDLAAELKSPKSEQRKKIVSLMDLHCSIPVAIGGSDGESSLHRQTRVQHFSETSESSQSSDDASCCSLQFQANEEEVATLKELFPIASMLEIKQCLALAGGDVQDAVQWILQRQESGESIKGIQTGKPNKKDLFVKDDESLKKLIISKYSYVDQDDDKKEHRPPPPKFEPKKLVRYRENQIVTVKGEKYTEVKTKESDDMKKTYVNLKPSRQYRFH